MHLYTNFALIFGGVILQVFLPGFPKELLLIQSGIVFGFLLGGLLNWLSMIIGAQIGYEVVRRSIEKGGKFHTLLIRYQHSRMIKTLNDKGNLGLFLIRLLPNAPNDLLSLIAGALILPRKGFFLVSVVTTLPYAFLFAYIGSISSNYFDDILLVKINIAVMVLSLVFIGIHRRLFKIPN
ncbi:MAG: TVP38/TMEM64 family protein [Candidatus Kariarchaeaceae archaeon]